MTRTVLMASAAMAFALAVAPAAHATPETNYGDNGNTISDGLTLGTTALVLPSVTNIISSVPASSSGIMPAAVNRPRLVFNTSSNPAPILPPSGAAWDALATNTAVTIAPGDFAILSCMQAPTGSTLTALACHAVMGTGPTSLAGSITTLLANTQTVSGAWTFSIAPVVPTATAGTSNTTAASTAFVATAVAAVSGGFAETWVTIASGSGTYTLPTGFHTMEWWAVAPGGPGGKGAVCATATACGNGAGGGGGHTAYGKLPAASFGTTITYQVGTPNPVSTGSGPGASNTGTQTKVGNSTAYPGGAGYDGASGSTASAGGGSAGWSGAGGNATSATVVGAAGTGSGVAGGTTAGSVSSSTPFLPSSGGGNGNGNGFGGDSPSGATGGGAGGSVSASNVASAGSASGVIRSYGVGQVAGAATCANGANGLSNGIIGSGGAGGGGCVGGNAGNGGTGGPGGGGGGGGAAQTGFTAGNGGAGGPGQIVLHFT